MVTNAGRADAYGFEGQARLAATDRVELFATYAYNHSRFKTGLRKGNRFRLSPDHSLSLGASLRAPLFGGELAVRPTYTWQSRITFDDDNDLPELQQPPRALVADNIRDEKVKIVKSLRRMTQEEIAKNVVRGQYAEGAINGKPVPGYRSEKGVKPDSKTELKSPYSGSKLALRGRRVRAPRRAEPSKSGGGVNSCPARQFSPSAS